MGSKFWFLPISLILMNFLIAVINHANVTTNKPIISFDYSAVIIFASIVIAVILEFVYLFIEKMVLE